ncbi:unnamed protein product [Gemmata massiliana]|uniref:Uncharacterized protein n=1 Tax=Gemmata massiliana TaxID=1210884 RepID=A0A6P2CSP6_9BACT|nr:unnamed protein product [Gemmata massiliana]
MRFVIRVLVACLVTVTSTGYAQAGLDDGPNIVPCCCFACFVPLFLIVLIAISFYAAKPRSSRPSRPAPPLDAEDAHDDS